MTATNDIHRFRQALRFCDGHGREAVGDPRDGTCLLCGHQVPGHAIPTRPKAYSLNAGDDRSTYAKPTRKFRPAQ